jgi:hypothetical protein
VRSERIEGLQAARATMADNRLAPMTMDEVQAEIAAYRAEQRR